jgi:hypothetical protein
MIKRVRTSDPVLPDRAAVPDSEMDSTISNRLIDETAADFVVMY